MNDDDDRGYAAATDEDLTGPADEEQAETQRALEEEAAARDAAISGDEPLSQMIDDPQHAEERARLGGASLAWWSDTSLGTAFNVLLGTIDEVEQHFVLATLLVEEGLPANSFQSTVELDFRTGPVMIGALQVLGLWAPPLREICTEVIAAIAASVPAPTAEEEAAIDAAHESFNRRTIEWFKGLVEEAKALDAADVQTDAELGLDPN
jgi:hypothetical protein